MPSSFNCCLDLNSGGHGMANTRVRITQLSGRYDRSPNSLRQSVAAAIDDSDIVLLTEVAGVRRRAVLQSFPGWTLHQDVEHGDAAEVAILTRDAVWSTRHFGAHVLAPDLGPGGRVIAGLAVLRHVHSRRLFMVSVSHLPATVEGNYAGARGQAHNDAVKRLSALHRAMRRTYRVKAEAAFADWNLNLHKQWVQVWIRKAFASATIARSEVIPAGGTHAGGRLIDWFVRRGWRVETWKILPVSYASDHRGIRVTGILFK